MEPNQQKPIIELRINRDFGQIISTYFDFLKQNIKQFANIFINYNGLFMVGLLVVSYLMVSGFMGLITSLEGGDGQMDNLGFAWTLGMGVILYLIIFLIVGVLNYSLAGSYMVLYQEKKSTQIDKRETWDFFKKRLGSIFLFVLLLVVIYVGSTVLGIVLAFIPLLGTLGYYVIVFFIQAWFGVSFFVMLQENKEVVESFGEGWRMVLKNFWKSVGVNFILGLLNGILMMVFMIIPGVLLGIYTYHAVETDALLTGSVVNTIVYTIGLSLFLMLGLFGQCLSQFVNGILYYGLHEKTYNTYTRSKIEQIGNWEEEEG